MGIIHADLKGDNIMFVNQRDKQPKVKLIDFGLAVPVSDVVLGESLQALPYRAPEVVMGMHITEAIDVWSLGCVVASLFLGDHLYPCRDEHELAVLSLQLDAIMDTHNVPTDLLEKGIKSHWYFRKHQGSPDHGWHLKASSSSRILHTVSWSIAFTHLGATMATTDTSLRDYVLPEVTGGDGRGR
ncbi:unnamed protein product [Merluccius merluccius]